MFMPHNHTANKYLKTGPKLPIFVSDVLSGELRDNVWMVVKEGEVKRVYN